MPVKVPILDRMDFDCKPRLLGSFPLGLVEPCSVIWNQARDTPARSQSQRTTSALFTLTAKTPTALEVSATLYCECSNNHRHPYHW
jgi:hypothetical protein